MRLRRSRSLGEFISSIVFFGFGLLLVVKGISAYQSGDALKGLVIGCGGTLSVVATFRFQISDLVKKIYKK